MKHLRQIAGKELSTFFSSLAAFIFLGVFLSATYFIFFWGDPFFARNIADIRPVFEWMPITMIFLVSALTMRMWSEERRAGTIETLLTSPVSNLELMTGKFIACLALVLIALALTLPLPLTVALVGPLDWGPVIGGYVASIFLAAAYAAIGLFISSRTDNQIVSLIMSCLVCSIFVLIGSDSVTSLFINPVAEIMKAMGAGSRFQSIIRGVIDFRDLYYYLSITGIFFSLNVLGLEEHRWAGNKLNDRHKGWAIVTVLFIANFVAGNFWLHQVSNARVDLTEGHIYSLSRVTRNYLANLKEPLLIRAYFSQRTHPLLAPLVPRMRDLLKEYAIAGKGKVRLEFIDPSENPALEKEAVEKYSIQPVTFQTASKYQAALTTSYFDILVKYGDQFETLGYRDLISLKSIREGNINVDLKNPEYDITRCIKKVMNSYQSTGNPFLGIDQNIKFVGYVSPDDKLPGYLVEAKKTYKEVLEDFKNKSAGKFTYEFVDPEANGGSAAAQIMTQFGFRPLPRAGTGDTFWFNLTLKDKEKLVAMQVPSDPSRTVVGRDLKSVLKRFSHAFIKTIGMYVPESASLFDATGDFRKSYSTLYKKLTGTHSVMPVNLEEGIVPSQVDLLLVLSPHKLSEKGVFAIDQFLMKGGTVIVSSAPYDANFARPPINCRKEESGLENWLKHYGIEFKEGMVLDSQDFPFIMPSVHKVGDSSYPGTELVSYPYFVDIRKDGMNPDGDITGALNQMTLTWASPVTVVPEKNKQRHVLNLLQSSPASWTSTYMDIVPYFCDTRKFGFPENSDKGRKLMAVAIEGSFESLYKGKESPLQKESKKDKVAALEVIEKSPDSARIILFGSNTFATDRMLFILSAGLGTTYENPLELIDNAVDWSMEDRDLLSIRGRGTFARTLIALPRIVAITFEYSNYVLGLAGLVLVWSIRRYLQQDAQKKYRSLLQAAAQPAAPQGGAS